MPAAKRRTWEIYLNAAGRVSLVWMLRLACRRAALDVSVVGVLCGFGLV
jgi:hypothetical protein